MATADTHGPRIDRLEQIASVLAEDQHRLHEGQQRLQEQFAELATFTRRGFDQLKEAGLETDRRMRETDGRIDKLVSATGELIRRQDAVKP